MQLTVPWPPPTCTRELQSISRGAFLWRNPNLHSWIQTRICVPLLKSDNQVDSRTGSIKNRNYRIHKSWVSVCRDAKNRKPGRWFNHERNMSKRFRRLYQNQALRNHFRSLLLMFVSLVVTFSIHQRNTPLVYLHWKLIK